MHPTTMPARLLCVAPLIVIIFICSSFADSYELEPDYHTDDRATEPKKPRLECFYQKQIKRGPQQRTVRQAEPAKLNETDEARLIRVMKLDHAMMEKEEKINNIIRNGRIDVITAELEGEVVLGEDNKTRIICFDESEVNETTGDHVKLKGDACMSMWDNVVDPATNKSSRKIIFAGCTQNDMGDGIARCPHEECGDRGHAHKFCCCNTTMCNAQIKDVLLPTVPPTPEDILPVDHRSSVLSVVGYCVGIAVLLVAFGFYLTWRFWWRKKLLPYDATKEEDEIKLCERFPGQLRKDDPSLDLGTLQLGEKIAQGRFGEVFMATIHGRIVAVKQFVPAQREYFLNECRIFNYPQMDQHDSILKFLGATDRKADLASEKVFWLIVEYHPNRSLIDHLKSRPVDAQTFSKMAYSLASGLAYLHAEIDINGAIKPAMAHRDFNSRNVLVREDLRLCICDMGFTMPFPDTSGSVNAPYTSTKLNDVGTVRYMAPEVLEGNLNLRDAAAALRQVDMYAFGLVLWELASRCLDLYYISRIPDYQLPYQKEVGLNPTFCEMQTLVAKKNARPVFPAEWKKDSTVGKFLKSMLEELWDTDQDGRLTCSCAAERLSQIGSMWGESGVCGIGMGMVGAAEPDVVQYSAVGDTDGPTELTGLLHEMNATVIPPNKTNVNEMMAVCNQIYPSLGFFSQNIEKYQTVIPVEDKIKKHDLPEEISASRNYYERNLSGVKF